jgi:hypothetical protein
LIYKLLPLLLFSLSALAFDKDFKTVNDRVPLEFNYLFDSMKVEIKSDADKIRMVGLCKDLDQNLSSLPKDQIFMLMKTEVIKNVTEHKFTKVRQFDITTLLMSRLDEDFKKKQKYLSSFSQWVWRSMMAELKYRQSLGLITARSFNPGNFEGARLKEAQRFQKYLDYLIPWIDRMDSLSPSDFNELTTEVSWTTLRRLNDRALLFKRFASTAGGDTTTTIFNIPQKLTELHPEDIKKMQNDSAPLTLKEESEKAKTEASKEIEKMTPEDLSPLSEDVSKELEKKTGAPLE